MKTTPREKLLVAMRNLILDRGYSGTSVDAVCTDAGVSKGSFFHHFRSKEHAALEAMTYWVQSMQASIAQSGFDQQTDPVDRLMFYLDWLAGTMEAPDAPKGCLLGSMALELSASHPEIRTQAADHFQNWIGFLSQLIGDAFGDRNDPDRSAELAGYFVASLEGAILMAKVREDRGEIRRSVLHFRQYMQQLLEQT